MKKTGFLLLICALLSGCQSSIESFVPPSTTKLPVAVDASEKGPFEISSGEYRLPPEIDNHVLPGVSTEVFAQVYYPKELSGALPLLLFLHGNYATCGSGSDPRKPASCVYTQTGACPLNQVMIPSHLGFEYIATRLASWGYLVVSINANRGITCDPAVDPKNTSFETSLDPGLIVARGRLVLKHLALLNEWNLNGGTPATLGFDFKKRIDFSQTGLLGHSRGGEGVRAAYNLYRESVKSENPSDGSLPGPLPEINVRGIFEIAPTDRHQPDRFNALDTAWNVLLPMCDGDVFSLEGRRPFDRMMNAESESNATPKSVFVVWGANHDYYNTAWQTSDSKGCAGPNRQPLWNGYVGSAQVQQTALVSTLTFFRAHVGSADVGKGPHMQKDGKFSALFDPLFSLPSSLTNLTPINRAYLKSPSLVKKLENFKGTKGFGISGEPFVISKVFLEIGGVPEHDVSVQAAQVTWNLTAEEGYLESLWSTPEKTIEMSGYESFDFRVSRMNSDLNSASPSTFEIQLIFEGGKLGPRVSLHEYISLLGPVGGFGKTPGTENLHSILQTVRISMSDLGVTESKSFVRGVRFTFPAKTKGAIYLTDFLATLKSNQ